MKIRLRQVDGVHFVATTDSGHEVHVDGSAEIGGRDLGARPMETVLVGLGGCSAIDVLAILRKARQPVAGCELEITAERADTIPAVFTRIHVQYRLAGDGLAEHKVRRAVSLSMDKYCSVTRMLEKTAEITYDFELVPAPPARPGGAA